MKVLPYYNYSFKSTVQTVKNTNNAVNSPEYKKLRLIQALNNPNVKFKTCSLISEIAEDIEKSKDLMPKNELLRYNKFINELIRNKQCLKDNIFYDSNRKKYTILYNLDTIQIEQEYEGIPFNACFDYIGDVNKNRMQNKQTGFVYPFYNSRGIEYDFKQYNLSDDISYCTALISKDTGKILSLTQAYNWSAPYKTKFTFDNNGKLKSAQTTVYNQFKYPYKDSKFIFDDNEKIIKVYYNINDNNKNSNAQKVFVKTSLGKFKQIDENS